MDSDIEQFIREHGRMLESAPGVSRRGGADEATIAACQAQFRERFNVDLPPTYVELCRFEDGFSTEDGEMFGMIERTAPGEELPWALSILGWYDSRVFDLGDEEFISFGKRSESTEDWGLDLVDKKFVRIIGVRTDRLQEFASFEDAFRQVFRLGK